MSNYSIVRRSSNDVSPPARNRRLAFLYVPQMSSEDPLSPMKPQVYTDPRPAAYFDRFHAHARTSEPDWFYTFLRVVSYPYCRLVYRLRAEETERVPAVGPVILAPNHFS